MTKREIKFRAWDTYDHELYSAENPPKRMVYFANPQVFDDGWLQLSSVGQSPIGDHGESRHILMQYTGLKDKNGVEIYEGDIIKIHFGKWVEYESAWNGDDVYEKEIVEREEKDYIGEVRWRTVGGIGFVVKELNNRWFRFNKRKTSEGVEVIGNIYENKELLND